MFKNTTEKRYWFYSLIIVIAIFSSLAFGRPLQEIIQNPTVQLILFVSGMVITATVIIIHGSSGFSNKLDLVIWLGIIGVSVLLFFRLGAHERSHLMEYGILAVFVHKAFLARNEQVHTILIGLKAFSLVVLIGLLDEGLQRLIPTRVFDWQDVAFNCLAAMLAIGGGMAIYYIKGLLVKTTKEETD